MQLKKYLFFSLNQELGRRFHEKYHKQARKNNNNIALNIESIQRGNSYQILHTKDKVHAHFIE